MVSLESACIDLSDLQVSKSRSSQKKFIGLPRDRAPLCSAPWCTKFLLRDGRRCGPTDTRVRILSISDTVSRETRIKSVPTCDVVKFARKLLSVSKSMSKPEALN